MTRTISIEHGDKTLYGHVATIESTTLGYESHGILSAYLTLSWGSNGISVGGYCLDQPRDRDADDYTRIGTAFGMDHIIRILETVGVESWESLKGQQVIVLFKDKHSWGSAAVGIAHAIDEEKVLILKEHAAEWREKENA